LRVESRTGARIITTTTFPVPARQTGRALLTHPAFVQTLPLRIKLHFICELAELKKLGYKKILLEMDQNISFANLKLNLNQALKP